MLQGQRRSRIYKRSHKNVHDQVTKIMISIGWMNKVHDQTFVTYKTHFSN